MTTLLRVRGIETTTPGFRAELLRVAQRLGLAPDGISGVIALESGFDPQANNHQPGDPPGFNPNRATGLIQFMPSTARRLGTTTDDLFRMNATEQLKYVELYFRSIPNLREGSRVGDYYLAGFMPAFIGTPDETPIAFKGTPNYDQNAGLDRNKDGVITSGDVRARLENELDRAKGVPPLVVDPLARPMPEEEAATAVYSSPLWHSEPLCFWDRGTRELGVEITPALLFEHVMGLRAEHGAFRTYIERLEAVARRLETVSARFDARKSWEDGIIRRVDELERAL
ncbi:MAG TPA: transglycosylase SLT domain-containing protein [Polyangiaceae bacterium]|nr:transglycosylase SLT domain-containing protein [Polyangiaceae bacterium]